MLLFIPIVVAFMATWQAFRKFSSTFGIDIDFGSLIEDPVTGTDDDAPQQPPAKLRLAQSRSRNIDADSATPRLAMSRSREIDADSATPRVAMVSIEALHDDTQAFDVVEMAHLHPDGESSSAVNAIASDDSENQLSWASLDIPPSVPPVEKNNAMPHATPPSALQLTITRRQTTARVAVGGEDDKERDVESAPHDELAAELLAVKQQLRQAQISISQKDISIAQKDAALIRTYDALALKEQQIAELVEAADREPQ